MAPKTKANARNSTSSTSRRAQKSDLTIALKDRKPKADKMTRKRKAITSLKSKLRLNRVREESDCEEQAPDLERRVGNNKGKARADLYQQHYQEGSMSDQQQAIQASTSSHIQYSAPHLSRDQPSGGFFEGPTDKVEIKGGTIHHTLGHHMNFTIQVNPPHEERYDTPEQPLHLPPLSPSSQTRYYDSVLPPTQDIQGGQFPPVSAYGIGSSTSTSTTIYSPDNSNAIYERHFMLKKRGFPLWIPEPSRTLPMPYRRKGVNIGDVGIITPTGGFSFLFNIFLRHNDPSNPPTLPDGFVPMDPLIHMDIREYSEFKPESYLASKAIEKITPNPQFRGLSFATAAAEGAVLTLPDGAISRDLENIPRFRAYVAANIESWYRYVNGPRGREAKNGEIRLVVGCDKATSWGMAAVADITERPHYLNYCPVSNDGVAPAPIPLYKWEYTGLAEARVGPDLTEIEDLKRNDDSDVAVRGKYWNQTLFIRTLNLTLNDEVFAAINQELESELSLELLHFQNKKSMIYGNPPNPDSETGSGDQRTGTILATRARSTKESLGSATENLAVSNALTNRVTISRFSNAPKIHPADFLNKVLLEMVPNCRVVITQDKDWCSVINEDDKVMPSSSEIAKRVMAAHYVREEDGIVLLEPKEEQESVPREHQTSSSPSTKGGTAHGAAHAEVGNEWLWGAERDPLPNAFTTLAVGVVGAMLASNIQDLFGMAANDEEAEISVPSAKRGRGRPIGSRNKKHAPDALAALVESSSALPRKRGRPPKEKNNAGEGPVTKRLRGRPPKAKPASEVPPPPLPPPLPPTTPEAGESSTKKKRGRPPKKPTA